MLFTLDTERLKHENTRNQEKSTMSAITTTINNDNYSEARALYLLSLMSEKRVTKTPMETEELGLVKFLIE